MIETPNQTRIRHDVLRSVDAGLITALVYLALRPGAVRALELFERLGYVDRGTGTRRLTDKGKALLAQWEVVRAAEDGR